MLMNRIAKVAPFTCAAQRAPVCARAVGRQSLRIRSSAVAEPALLPYKAIDGSDKGTQSLALRVADPSTAKAVVHRYMVMVRRNARRGTASTLTRSEVRGGGKKPYAQKGTGNARRGSSVSPLFPGGGITFGPKPKDWKIKMNKKERRLAMATTLQSSAEDITVVESLAGKVSDKKTRTLLALLKQMTGFDAMKQKVLLILKERDEGVILAGRNVEKLYINTTDEIRVLDVMKAHKIVIEDGALEQIKSMFGGAAAQPEEAVAAYQLGLTTATAKAFEAEHAAYSHWDSVFKVGRQQGVWRILTDGVSVCVQYTRPLDYTPPGPSGSSPAAGPAADLSGSSPAANPPGPSGSSPAAGPAADPSGPSDSSQAAEDPSDSSSSNKRTPADIGRGLADERAFLFDPATQMGMGLDPGAIQAVSAASGMWRADGRLQGFYRSKLTRSQVQHDSGLSQAHRNTQRWNENISTWQQPPPAGTSLVAIQRHVAVTLATWDAVWGEYLHPKWAEQRMRLHGAQEKVLERYFMKLEEEAASVSQQEWGTRKQLVVFFGNAGIGTRGGWGAKAVLQACHKVVERANSGKPTDRVPGRVVTVDEFRTSRVSAILNSPQPCEEELDRSKPTRLEGWKPKPGQVQDRLLRSAWSQRFEAPVRGLMWCPWLAQATPGDLGKWVDRDCNAALNLQRAGESKWRPLELCRWPIRGRLPAQGKEYPALGFKKLRERAPKVDGAQLLQLGQQRLVAGVRKDTHEHGVAELAFVHKAPLQLVSADGGILMAAAHANCSLAHLNWSQQRDQSVRGLMWCLVVAPRKPPQAPCSSQAATQPAASEPGPSTPPPAKRSKPAAEPTKGKGKGKAAKAKPAPQPGRWLDRDCNAALHMQRIGESRWRPLELCYWPDICDGFTLLFSMVKKKRRTVPRLVPEDPDSDIEDRDEALQPDLTEAERNRKVSGEARAARDRDNTYHGRKCKLAHLIDHLPQELWDAFLADAVQPRVEAISERAVLASPLLGLLVRGLFTIHVADPLGLHDQPVYTDIPVSQAAIPDLSCRNLFLQLVRGLTGNGANTRPNAAVAAVLAAHPDLRDRLAAIPRYPSDTNMVDHVGKQLETAFNNMLTLLFAGRLKKSVSLAGAKVLVGTNEHQRRFGFKGLVGGHLPAWSKRQCTYVRRMVCGLDVTWLLEEGAVLSACPKTDI
ncbi:hypothetical protein QJQ45_015747 [Haematococcus lacustris]|nr:hypothetical protein QJQ45_015747 [Haematococcus lacustris]